MTIAKQTSKPPPRPPLRAEQAALTRARIDAALAELLHEHDGVERLTFKALAQRAGVTEMTVYRHFPTRDALLQAVWQQMNREMGYVRMPDSVQTLLDQHAALHAGFDRIAPQIMASLSTPQGRAMRASLNRQRRKAFGAIVDELAPGLDAAARTRAAGVIQLLHSAYAWASLREQWGLSGAEAGKATRWAIDLIINHLRSEK